MIKKPQKSAIVAHVGAFLVIPVLCARMYAYADTRNSVNEKRANMRHS